MSRRLLSLVLVIACTAGSVLVAQRASATTWQSHSRGQLAFAYYAHFVPDPNPPATPTPGPYPYAEASAQSYPGPSCGTYEYVFLFVGERVSSSVGNHNTPPYPQPGNPERFLSVTAGGYNNCSGISSVYGWASTDALPAAAFKMDGALNRASLKATMTLFDTVAQQEVPLAVDLSWTGSGERFDGDFHYQQQNQLYGFVVNVHGSSRLSAFRGTLAIGARSFDDFSGTGYLSDSLHTQLVISKH